MFKFLKEKIGGVVKKFSKEVEEEAEIVEEPQEELKEEKEEKPVKKEKPKKEKPKEKKEVKKKEQELKEKPEETPEEKKEEPVEKEPEPVEEEPSEAAEEEPQEKKGFFKKIFTKKPKEEIVEEKKEEKPEEAPKQEEKELEPVEEQKEKKSFFKSVSDTITKIKLSPEKFEELFWDIEITLLENNVAVEVIQKIKEDLKEELTKDKIPKKNIEQLIKNTLRKSITEVLSVESLDLEEEIGKKKPYVIAVIGVNGSGKTTTIAKLVHKLKENNHSVVLGAADTFRAAAIQQLEEHANKLDVKLIKHDYNSDPAAVAFDAVKHAKAKGLDVVVIDTAGRLHSNDNLMNELKKLIRVNTPDLKLFVAESITGNDCVEQAKVYNEIIGIDAIILSKADIDEKGGAAISISHVTKKPVLYLGTGQKYSDLEAFDKEKIVASLGL